MEAVSNAILVWVTFAYLAASVLYLCQVILKRDFFGKTASLVTWLALAAHTTSFIMRWIAMNQLGYGHAPFSNLFESLVFFGWTLALLYLILELRTGLRTIGAFALPLVFFVMLYAIKQDGAIKPLMPALQSNWLIAHVITCFLGYAGFGISAALSLMYLVAGHEKKDTARSRLLDDLIYKMVVLGFILLTAGIVTGSIWANSAWGTYWSWDPKETWSLITWLVYAALLHSRYMRGWQGNRIAWFSLLGFGCVLFTYFGVTYLLTGMHSYATM
ncbi:MAG: cytochrome c biogenesis protein CcsA [Deltaproteobacteria bacterium]|nr:cytochrome c biogenesis protein CcsA [Deltaproteobacteria bacterium]